MTERQLLAFWRIAVNRHNDGISLTFGGSEHTYKGGVHYWPVYDDPDAEGSAIVIELSKRERNNW